MKRLTGIAIALALTACGAPKHAHTPGGPAQAPPIPTWATSLVGQPLTKAFPHHLTTCSGYVDTKTALPNDATSVSVAGWGWNDATHAKYDKVVVVDNAGVIQGAGDVTVSRQDVGHARADITEEHVGFNARSHASPGVLDVVGIDQAAKTECKLGSTAS